MFGHWEGGGEAHLLPGAKILGSQGAAPCGTDREALVAQQSCRLAIWSCREPSVSLHVL